MYGGSAEQFEAPAPEYVPDGQIEQPAAASVPGLVTAPAQPGAQIVQAATEVLPVCEPVVYVPVGQAVHVAFAVPLPEML